MKKKKIKRSHLWETEELYNLTTRCPYCSHWDDRMMLYDEPMEGIIIRCSKCGREFALGKSNL